MGTRPPPPLLEAGWLAATAARASLLPSAEPVRWGCGHSIPIRTCMPCSGAPGPCVWALFALRALTSEESFAPPALWSGKGASRKQSPRRPPSPALPRAPVGCGGVCVGGGASVQYGANRGHHSPRFRRLLQSCVSDHHQLSLPSLAAGCVAGYDDALADAAAVDPKTTTTSAAIDRRSTGQGRQSNRPLCRALFAPVSIAPAPCAHGTTPRP